MTDRKEIPEEQLEDVVGGNLTYTWYGGKGTCGLNGNNKWTFTNKTLFESTLNECMREKGMTDVETLKYMQSHGIIKKG